MLKFLNLIVSSKSELRTFTLNVSLEMLQLTEKAKINYYVLLEKLNDRTLPILIYMISLIYFNSFYFLFLLVLVEKFIQTAS